MCGWQESNRDQSAILVPVLKGDLNCDKVVSFADINAFVLALTNPSAYQAAFPACFREGADMDASGTVDFGDINAFVTLLTGQ